MPYAPNRTLPLLTPADCTMAKAREEFEQVAQALQDRAEEASQQGHAGDAFSLHTAAGIITDRWLALNDAPDHSEAPAQLSCSCHGNPKELEQARRLLNKWLPKAMLNIRQIANALEEKTLHPQNIYRWANAARICVDKIVLYHTRLIDVDPNLAFMGAHRHEFMPSADPSHPTFIDRLNIAREQIAAMRLRDEAR